MENPPICGAEVIAHGEAQGQREITVQALSFLSAMAGEIGYLERCSDWKNEDEEAKKLAVTDYSVEPREVMSLGTTQEDGGL